MNFVEIIGNLVADPEERATPDGRKVTTLRLADNFKRGKTEEVIWWRVTIWGDDFSYMIPHLKKGSSLIVYGELKKPEAYTDKNGQAQVAMELTARFMRFGPSRASSPQEGATQYASQNKPSYGNQNTSSVDDLGDIEFVTPGSSGGQTPGGFSPAQGGGDMEDKLPF